MDPARRLIALSLLATTAIAAPAAAGRAAQWKDVRPASLDVTEGQITPAGKATARVRSAAMRAVMRDGGRHARRARLRFRLLGDSETIKPLGSGLVRQQIGLKLRAADPCNLLYVMWHSKPESSIQIQIKRNPGQTTSAQCGNRGYTEIASVPRPRADGRAHVLEARTRATRSGTLTVAVYAEGRLAKRVTIPAAFAAGLAGPAGVRSDNGHYLFRLSVPR